MSINQVSDAVLSVFLSLLINVISTLSIPRRVGRCFSAPVPFYMKREILIRSGFSL
jgi:hypothetical protein